VKDDLFSRPVFPEITPG